MALFKIVFQGFFLGGVNILGIWELIFLKEKLFLNLEL